MMAPGTPRRDVRDAAPGSPAVAAPSLVAHAADAPAWVALGGELDAWRAAGRTPSLWWRDDDAVAPSPALDRLLDLRARWNLPLTLAVIPRDATDALARALDRHDPPAARADWPMVRVAVHGVAHQDHAEGQDRRQEFTASHPDPREVASARAAIAARFGARAVPILVPPWNRLDPVWPPRLAGLGFAGYSTHGPRAKDSDHGLVVRNTHVDLMAWRPARFAGTEKVIDRLVRHLAARRAGTADPAESTGLLTHHLVHDDAAWAMLDRLFAALTGAVRWTALEADTRAEGGR